MDQQPNRANGSLSFLYYPTGTDAPTGHAEMEVEGTVWNLIGDKNYGSRSLKKTIKSATTNGMPFFRFVFTANREQARDIHQYIYKSRWSVNCSRAALYPLSKIGVCSVPFPINVSPLCTALYLKAGAVLGTNNVKHIEYYGNPSLKISLLKMLPGAAVEIPGAAGAVWIMCATGYMVLKCTDCYYAG